MRFIIFFLTWLPALSLAQASWNIEDVARWPGQTVSLKHGNRVVGTVQVSQATALLSVARRLSDAAGIYVSVILVEGNSPNAFVRNSTGSNVVEVNLGLLRVFGDDIDALAAVIGHEIGHIGRRHLDEKSSRDTLLDIVGLIVGISLDYKIGLKTGASSTLGQTLTTIGGTMVSRKFDRDQEREADELAVQWMHAAGFDTNGAVRVMQSFSSSFDLFSTHPMSEERVANIRRQIATLPSQPVAAGPAIPKRESPKIAADGAMAAELQANTGDPNDPIALGLQAYVEGRHFDAFRYASLAASKGDPRGQLALGYCLLLGIGAAKDYAKAGEWFARAAAQESATANTMLGIMHIDGQGFPVSQTVAASYFTKAADARFAPGMARLAALKVMGDASLRDYAGGFVLAQKAALSNDPLAHLVLGLAFGNGYGVEKNLREALVNLEKSSKAGNLFADVVLGEMYLMGTGVLQNIPKATLLFSNAMQKGNPGAKAYLGLMYIDGTGVKKDFVTGKRLFEEALAQGIAVAAMGLGYVYGNGLGVPADQPRALAYFELAATAGHKPSEALRDTLRTKLSVRDIERSGEIAREISNQVKKR